MFVGKEGGNPLFSFDTHICKTAVISSNKQSFLWDHIWCIFCHSFLQKNTHFYETIYGVKCMVYCIKLAPCENIIQYALCTMYYGYTMYYVLCTMYYVLCTMYYVLYTTVTLCTIHYGYTMHYLLKNLYINLCFIYE